MAECMLLLSLLSDISSIVSKNDKDHARDEIPQLFCQAVEAQDCAVYLHGNNDYQLYRQYSPSDSSEFIAFLGPYARNLSTSAAYFVDQEESGGFFKRGIRRRCLVLPLSSEDKPAGFLVAAWSDTSPLDGLNDEEFYLLQPIILLLSDIYCTLPLVAALKQRESSLVALYQKSEEELENNRKQVSIELHDEVGQVLTSILLQLKLLQQSDNIEYIKGRLDGLHHITMQTLEEVRRISHNQRPMLLEKLGLQATLEAHIKEYTESTGITVEMKCNNIDDDLPAATENIIYRAVQEGLTNVARHAEASAVQINLRKKGSKLFLQIVDNGKGMDDAENYGMGLLGMKERVNLAKGRFWLLNQKGQGLSLNILLPLT